jgi:outer membrane receptor protein involved in Fe transport
MPQELVITKGYFEKWSHELRISSPKDLPFKVQVGAFIQRQQHDIWEQYTMPGYGFTNAYGNPALGPNPNGLADSLSIPGLENTIWLTDEQRVDRDKAVFFNFSWNLDAQWSLNGGLRYFKYDNSLEGFYGYSKNFDAVLGTSTGVGNCFAPASTPYAPCTDLDKTVSDSGTVPRVNLTYKIDADRMVYATYSKGFRPGGVNRTAEAGIGPYQPDFLTNYEIGWKTSWFNHHVRWNGAAFWENWKNFQFSFLGPSSLTIIENGGNARIKGIENELEWSVTNGLTLSANFTFLDPRLTENYCAQAGVTSCPDLVTPQAYGPALIGPQAPAGTNLPVQPKFKGNFTARYTWEEIDGWRPFGQASWMYQTETAPLLLTYQVNSVGMQPAYGLIDLTLGMHQDTTMVQLVVTNLIDRRAQLTRFTQTTQLDDNQPYIIPTQPRTIALKFGQKF